MDSRTCSRGVATTYLIMTACFAALIAPASAAQLSPVYPCRDNEPPPGNSEPNPTVRDPVMTFENRDTSGPDILAEACFVAGAAAENAPNGLWLDWNLALLEPGTGLADVFGTVVRLGPVTGVQSDAITQSLVGEWRLGADQPQVTPDWLLAQVGVEPCQDLTADCGHSADNAMFVTTLLRPQENRRGESELAARDMTLAARRDGCLSPVGRTDPVLRELSVIAHGTTYAVYACLVSGADFSFKAASMSVELLAADGTNPAQRTDGNTRMHIGPLFGGMPGMPKAVVLFGVDIPAKNATVPVIPVTAANVTLKFQACTDAHWNQCGPLRVTMLPHHVVRFAHRRD